MTCPAESLPTEETEMKPLRFALLLSLPLALLACSPPSALAQSSVQKPFDQIKSLAGAWEGTLTTFPAAGETVVVA
jgi:hypothetical protein